MKAITFGPEAGIHTQLAVLDELCEAEYSVILRFGEAESPRKVNLHGVNADDQLEVRPSGISGEPTGDPYAIDLSDIEYVEIV